MAQLVKSIVNELNKTPYNLNFTVVSFSGLQPIQLIQVISYLIIEGDH